MKKSFTIGLIIFWSLVILLLLAGLVVYGVSKPNQNSSQVSDVGADNYYKNLGLLEGENTNNMGDSLAMQLGLLPEEEEGISYTTELRTVEKQQYMSAQIVSEHNSKSDCWHIIEGNVYDVTNYIPFHPGGVDTIVDSCGTDATAGYNDRDGKGTPHSSAADVQLRSLFVAAIGDPWGTVTVTEEVQVPSRGGQASGVDTNYDQYSDQANMSDNTTVPVKFVVGEKVRTTDSVRGRQSPSTSGTVVATLPVGSVGKVLSGPTASDGYMWYQIYYNNGTTAWSVQDYFTNAANEPVVTNVEPQTYDPEPVEVAVSQPAINNSAGSLNTAEVAKHSRVSDCWIIVSGMVYNVTEYLPFHPGGQSTITPHCGKEATVAFETMDGEGSHSATAYQMLDNYYVGILVGGNTSDTTTSTDVNTATQTCRSFSYTAWSECSVNGVKTRSVTASSPTGCIGGAPLTTYSCTYTPPVTNSGGELTVDEIADHDRTSDCWLIIDDKVYDVTEYMPFHPGGESTIVPYCGEESTEAFANKGDEGSDHSSSAYNMLDNYYIGNVGSDIVADPSPPSFQTCRSFTYSPWAACQTNGTQVRSVLASSPSGCVNGSPLTTRSCTYVPPVTTCTGFTYGNWSACQSDGTQTRGVISSSPTGCVGGTRETVRSCTYIPPVTTPDSCTSFTYGSWSACQSDGTQTRSVTGIYPNGCTGGNPSNSRSCTYTPPVNTPAPSSGYSLSEVATHNRSSDCWMVIEDKVYDVTQYIPYHPGGQSRIINNCGIDATSIFAGGGGNHRHSSGAYNDLPPYYVGDVSSGNTTPTTNTCTAFSYSNWSACQSNYLQTRTVTASSPSGCTAGSPVIVRSCAYNTSLPEDYVISVNDAGNFSNTNLNLSVGDSITFTFSGSGEAYINFSPTTISTLKIDHETIDGTRRFNSAGSWTARVRDTSGGTLYINVQ